jgi:hypothetical protein
MTNFKESFFIASYLSIALMFASLIILISRISILRSIRFLSFVKIILGE